MSAKEEFTKVLHSLSYETDTSIYADNWKHVVPKLIDILSEYRTEFPEEWYFGLTQLEISIMITVCTVCNDIPYFNWLRNLRNAYKNNTEVPEMPSCADCRLG